MRLRSASPDCDHPVAMTTERAVTGTWTPGFNRSPVVGFPSSCAVSMFRVQVPEGEPGRVNEALLPVGVEQCEHGGRGRCVREDNGKTVAVDVVPILVGHAGRVRAKPFEAGTVHRLARISWAGVREPARAQCFDARPDRDQLAEHAGQVLSVGTVAPVHPADAGCPGSRRCCFRPGCGSARPPRAASGRRERVGAWRGSCAPGGGAVLALGSPVGPS